MRKRQYVEDRGAENATKQAMLKGVLFPAMGGIFLCAIAVESGALQGSREDRLRLLLRPSSHAELLDEVDEKVIILNPLSESVDSRAVMRLDERRLLECNLHDDGDITRSIRHSRSRATRKPWTPGPEFDKPLDALCGAMIATSINRMTLQH